MKKIRIGVLGGYRGTSMINFCECFDNADVVAICDKNPEVIERQKQDLNDDKITYYSSFDEFIKHDMDAVVLANYAHQHTPFAIKAMNAGIHVFSEVLPCQTMKEAVELVEAVEKTGMIYAYGENYCYMSGPYEMKRLFKEGKVGQFEYGECEYLHNCAPIWPSITYGEKDHWRNRLYSTFYCTHSLGPMIHISGLRPIKVVGLENPHNLRKNQYGGKTGMYGIEMVTLENGAIIKSVHGGTYKDSIWYCINGSKGRVETARQDALIESYNRIYVNVDEYEGQNKPYEKPDTYIPKREYDKLAEEHGFGHGGSDFYCMYHFIEKLLGNKDADIIDVYEALDMSIPGILAYRSILEQRTIDIPNFRNPEEREKYRNDTACTDPEIAGDMLWPTTSLGTPDIEDEVYERAAKIWNESKENNEYVNSVRAQGKKISK